MTISEHTLTETIIADHIIDARRLFCPLPVIRTQDAIKTLATGTIVKVICTDPGALSDIPAWCRLNQHKVLATKSQAYEYFVWLEVV